jgi:hypothetical protein
MTDTEKICRLMLGKIPAPTRIELAAAEFLEQRGQVFLTNFYVDNCVNIAASIYVYEQELRIERHRRAELNQNKEIVITRAVRRGYYRSWIKLNSKR